MILHLACAGRNHPGLFNRLGNDKRSRASGRAHPARHSIAQMRINVIGACLQICNPARTRIKNFAEELTGQACRVSSRSPPKEPRR